MKALEAPIEVATDHVRVLIVEDNAFDAELFLMALKRAGMPVIGVTAEDEQQLRAALVSFVPDIVLSDFSFPNFDGLTAHQIVHEAFPDCPVIFVSGTISEERAALALQCGAVDYVMKSTLVRLPLAVDRAVRSARSATDTAKRTQRHVKRLETLWGLVNDPKMRRTRLVNAMLSQAAGDLSAEQRFVGYLCEGSADNAKVVNCSTFEACSSIAPEILFALGALGESTPAAGARTRSWADAGATPDAPGAFARAGWRAVISTAFESDGSHYWLTFAASDAAIASFGHDDFAYLDVLAACFANQVRFDAIEDSLRDGEERSRRHAHRLEASWQIVNDTGLSDQARWLAMLSQAAAHISHGHGYRGTLWRIHGEEMTCEAVGEAPGHGLPPTIEVGTVLPVAASTIGLALAAGMKSRSWDDFRSTEPQSDWPHVREVRSTIVATFRGGDATWGISFASRHANDKPFGALEHAYLDVLSSYFSSHVERRWHNERFRFEREHDGLTGLLNRSQFHAEAAAASSRVDGYAIAVFDIGAFHEINESFGAAMGDAVLVECASALLERATSGEIVGRIGGDVFAVYVANVSPGYVRARVHDFAGAFARQAAAGGPRADATIARAGVAVSPDDGDDIATILSRSGAALAIAKARRPGAIVYYEAAMELEARRRTLLRDELAEALAQDQFTLHYQPHVEIATGRVVGCEVLIRWDHPTRGLVPPFDFIPFAEETGLITSIDNWVMRQSFKAAAYLATSRPDFRLYFNISGRRMGDASLIRSFVDAAREGVPLKNLGVEITETDAMRDVAATRRVLRALRRLNVRSAIDDFGMGYSSLASLRQLPVDIVKIDRSFVSGVTNNKDDAAMAETIISIAEHFEFESLGEGAETEAEIDWLRTHACRFVQGYAICRPLPIEKFEAWLADYDAKLPAKQRRDGAERRRRERRKSVGDEA